MRVRTSAATRSYHGLVPQIDLVVTCYHGNEEHLLEHDGVARIRSWVEPHDAMVTLLVNNVRDHADTAARIAPLLADGLVTRALRVDQHADEAFARTGTRRRDFGRYLHWSDAPLVALTVPGPDLLLYWDAGAELLPGSRDWIGPAAELLTADEQVLAANPRWADEAIVETELDSRVGDVGLGYGFSDQVFLLRRSRAPRSLGSIVPYWIRCPASVRYPFTGAVAFEQLVDVHMRTTGRLRATFMGAEYRHRASGHAYQPTTLAEKVAFRRNARIRGALARRRYRDPRLREGGLRG